MNHCDRIIWIIKKIWEKEWFIYESVASIINHECVEVSFLGGLTDPCPHQFSLNLTFIDFILDIVIKNIELKIREPVQFDSWMNHLDRFCELDHVIQ